MSGGDGDNLRGGKNGKDDFVQYLRGKGELCLLHK